MPVPRRLAARAELDRHLAWLRTAVHDRQMDRRLIFESIIDALDALADMIPGPPPKER